MINAIVNLVCKMRYMTSAEAIHPKAMTGPKSIETLLRLVFIYFCREFDGNGEDLHTSDHPRHLLGNIVLLAPSLWIEGCDPLGTKDYVNYRG
jgi:hypothetical protein